MHNYLAIGQQQITVPQTSWVGNMSMAGVGIMLIVLSVLSIRGRKKRKASGPGDERVPMLLWSPLVVSVGDRFISKPTGRLLDKMSGVNANPGSDPESDGLDWKSLLTFVVGAFSTTALLSSAPGAVLSITEWFQSLIMALADWPILSDLGAAGLCFFLLILAFMNRDDDMRDLVFGAACGIIWPLGGGSFTEMSLTIGSWVPALLQIG